MSDKCVGQYRGLKPFVKGDPRRINKPKGCTSISTELRNILNRRMTANDIDGNRKSMTIKKLLSLAAVKKALSGDTRSFEVILERIEGKVPSDINLGGQADNPLSVVQLVITNDQSKSNAASVESNSTPD